MEQSPSWATNRSSASQKNPSHFMEPEVFTPTFTIARHLSRSWTRSSNLCTIPLIGDLV